MFFAYRCPVCQCYNSPADTRLGRDRVRWLGAKATTVLWTMTRFIPVPVSNRALFWLFHSFFLIHFVDVAKVSSGKQLRLCYTPWQGAAGRKAGSVVESDGEELDTLWMVWFWGIGRVWGQAGKALVKSLCHKTWGIMFGISDSAFAQRGRSSLTLVGVLAASGAKQGKKAPNKDSFVLLKMKHADLMFFSSFYINISMNILPPNSSFVLWIFIENKNRL